MKAIRTLALALTLGILSTACSEGQVEAGAALDGLKNAATQGLDSLKDLDFSSLDPAALKEKLAGATSGLTEQLSAVKDKASAENVAQSFAPLADKLSSMKETLGDKMPTLDSLKSAVETLKSKFAGNEGIMNALKPLLEKLQSLFQG